MIREIMNIWVGLIMTAVVVLLYYNTIVNEKKKNALKEKELENQKMELMMKIDTKAARAEVDALVERYFGEYTLYNFVAQKVVYIKKEDAELAVKEITKRIILNISETYIFYIKVLYFINDEDSLLEKITDMVSEQMISYMVEYNRPKE
jgi:hypothetical protein